MNSRGLHQWGEISGRRWKFLVESIPGEDVTFSRNDEGAKKISLQSSKMVSLLRIFQSVQRGV